MERFAWLSCLSALLAWSEVASAQSPGPCPSPGQPWVEVIFSGPAWSAAAQDDVLRELGIELRRRSLQVCPQPAQAPSAPPLKLITLLANDPERVAIVPSDLEHEGGFVGRTIMVGGIPEDARPLAIAQAVDEALRSDSGAAPEPPPREKKKSSRRALKATPTSPSWVVAAAVAPALQVAPGFFDGESRTAVAPGVGLRLSVTESSWGGSLGVTLTKVSDLRFDDIVVRQFRAPLDASLRYRLRKGLWEGVLDVGVLAALVSYDYSPSDFGQRRLEWGGRAGISVGWGRRVKPWLGASIELLPSPSELRFAPTGSFGHTPSLWLGFTLGTELTWP